MTHAAAFNLRAVTTGLLGAVAGVYLDLGAKRGYHHVSPIGPLFPLNAIAGSSLPCPAPGRLATPRRLGPGAVLAVTSRHQPTTQEVLP